MAPNLFKSHRVSAHGEEPGKVNVSNFKRAVPEGYYELFQCPDCPCKGFTLQDMIQHKCGHNKGGKKQAASQNAKIMAEAATTRYDQCLECCIRLIPVF